jgi:DNA polymerase-1
MTVTSTSDSTPAPASGAPQHVYLVDGSGYIFRAFHALPPMTRPDGTPVNAVYGFTNMLLKLLGETDADCVAVIFDAGRSSFRNELYSKYKAQRPDPPDELIPQFALIHEATRAFNLPCIEQAGFEADDLIATYAKEARAKGSRVTIVSSDKDLMQLVREGVEMFDPIKNRVIGPAEVEEKFGVPPEKVIEVQALAGDSVDNVPGVPGIGIKTAAQLIKEYGDLDTLLARAGEIKQPKRREALIANADAARLSRQLVTLRDDVPLDEPIEALGLRRPDADRLIAFLREQAFRRILERVETLMRGGDESLPAFSPLARAAAIGGAPSSVQARPESGKPATPDAPLPPAPIGRDYELVQEEAQLKWWIGEAELNGLVAIGVETNSPFAMRAELVGISLALRPGKACYIPIGHHAPRGQGALALGDGGLGDEGVMAAPRQLLGERVLELLTPLLSDPSVLKIGHDIKYAMLVLSRYRVSVTPIEDAMLLSYVLGAGLHGHDMDELTKRELEHDRIQYKHVTGSGKGQIGFAEVPLEKACDYAAEDADVNIRLQSILRPRLLSQRLLRVYELIDRPLVPVLMEMERAGIKVDLTELKRLSDDFAERLAALEREVHGLAGESFNLGSPKQLGEILFDRMSLQGGKKGKTGAYVTDAETLEELAAQGHDLPARVLDWRQLQKLKSTYADALMEEINPETGRVHTYYAMAIASTGRLSSTDPNLQNIPIRTEEGRKIRRAFVAEEGHMLVSLDYSQIELRLLAHVAGIEALSRAFKEGIDIHALTASEMFGVPVQGMDPMIRRKAKAINFGIVYGISPFGLARQLGIPQGEAAAYIKAYFLRYPGIRDYMEETKALARKQGYVETIFGRRIHVTGINERNPARRGFAERAAINAPIQGGAADIIKRAMIRVPDALAESGLRARMLLQVHDELLFEAPEAEVERCIAVVRDVMGGAAQLSVPLLVEAGAARNWAEAH